MPPPEPEEFRWLHLRRATPFLPFQIWVKTAKLTLQMILAPTKTFTHRNQVVNYAARVLATHVLFKKMRKSRE